MRTAWLRRRDDPELRRRHPDRHRRPHDRPRAGHDQLFHRRGPELPLAQRRLDFRTIITSRKLLEKIKCPEVDGMVFIEDIAAAISAVDKFAGALRAAQSADRICRALHAASADDTAVILFTSGSERDPEGGAAHARAISSPTSTGCTASSTSARPTSSWATSRSSTSSASTRASGCRSSPARPWSPSRARSSSAPSAPPSARSA